MSPSGLEVSQLDPLQALVRLHKSFLSDGLPHNHRPYHVQDIIVAIRMRPWRHLRLQDVLPPPLGIPAAPACCQAARAAGTDMLNDIPSEPLKLENHLKDL
jgi:hypothetical protein